MSAVGGRTIRLPAGGALGSLAAPPGIVQQLSGPVRVICIVGAKRLISRLLGVGVGAGWHRDQRILRLIRQIGRIEDRAAGRIAGQIYAFVRRIQVVGRAT